MDNYNILSVRNLCAGYGKKKILHNISMDFSPGKITAIIGPNGCGKSTLLKTIVKLIPKISGEISVSGTHIEKLGHIALARQIAYVPQSRSVPELTVMSMALHGRFPYLNYPRRYRKEDIEIAKKALEITELTDYSDEYISNLSGGTRQRVYLAMALAQSTPIILMDEPSSFMDISFQIKLMELCKMLAEKGKAVIMVLHDLASALKYADYIIVMRDGKNQGCGTPEEVFESGILNNAFNVEIKRINSNGQIIYYW